MLLAKEVHGKLYVKDIHTFVQKQMAIESIGFVQSNVVENVKHDWSQMPTKPSSYVEIKITIMDHSIHYNQHERILYSVLND